MYIYYCFGFLTLEQKYLCRFSAADSLQQCAAETICLNREFSGFEWHVDEADSDYLYNWQQVMGLMCMPRTTINYMVSAYFVCYTVAGLLFFTIPDKIGVKRSMALFGTLHCLI